MSILLIAFVANLASSQLYQNSINIKNTPKSSNNNTVDLQELRDWWCNSTVVSDRNYNSSTLYYFRATRSNFLGSKVREVINHIQNTNSLDFIQTIRWPFGVALTLLLIIFLTWIFFLLYLGWFKKSSTSTGGLIFGLSIAKLAIFLFVGIFIFIMIMIAFSEISQRRSKCQLLNVGNYLLNGYISSHSGTQYVGLVALQEAVVNFRGEFTSVASLQNSATDILNANFPALAQQNVNAARNVATAFASQTTFNQFGQPDTPNSIKNLNEWVDDGIKREFNEFNDVSASVHGLGQGTYNLIQANAVSSSSSSVSQTLNSLNAFFVNITGDVYLAAKAGHKNLRWSYTYASGGYWTIFALSLVLIPIAIILSSGLTKAAVNENKNTDFKFYKILLAVFGFLMLWYAIVLIILLAGSGYISSFCTILSNVNQGNLAYIDSLNIVWPGNTRQIAKECIGGKTGNLLNFISARGDVYDAGYVNDIYNIVKGSLNYRAYYFNTNIISSSAVAFAGSRYRSILAGIQNDYIGVGEQFNFVNASFVGTAGQYPSLTTWLCNTRAVAVRPNCLPFDTTALNVFGSQATYSNFTVVANLQKYIQSEGLVLNSLIQNLDGRVDILTPAQAFRNSKLVLDSKAASVNAIGQGFKNTLSPFSQYTAQGTYALDCRGIRKELAILEDHYCFELNYWVYIILVVSAVSLVLLFIIGWSFFGVICELDTNEAQPSVPAYQDEQRADINEREKIPSA